jgi:hypothetical protein
MQNIIWRQVFQNQIKLKEFMILSSKNQGQIIYNVYTKIINDRGK